MVEPVLQISNLVKNFGALRATDGVTLDLRPGEIHALIGPNGAGKSTLIHQICGTLRQDSGTIRFAGQDVGALTVAERARLGLGAPSRSRPSRRNFRAPQRHAGGAGQGRLELPLLQACHA